MSGIKHFSGFEVIRAAKEVEKNGHRFYSTMSERASDPALKDIFTWLAQDEVEHLRRLNQLESKYQDGSLPIAKKSSCNISTVSPMTRYSPMRNVWKRF